ncbi:DUF6346 domain-containing protein [Salinifilum ghardaiensis]
MSLVFSLVGAVMLLSGPFVVMPWFGANAAGAEVSKKGAAEAQRCRYSVLISDSEEDPDRNITGLGWVCWAKVTWDSGEVRMREVKQSQLKPADIGQSIRVVGREVSIDEAGGRRTEVFRADYEPSPILAGAGLIACVVIGLSLSLAFPSYLRMLYKHRRREGAR